MRHRRKELALDAVGLSEGVRLGRLPDEFLPLGAQRVELAKDSRHEVRRENEDAHVEREPRRLDGQPVGI